MSAIVDGLKLEMHKFILGVMPTDPSGELEAMNLADLLITYGTWISRLIPKHPRTVMRSAELVASLKAAEHANALTALVEKIERGDDLTPHLSKAVAVAYEAGADAARKPSHRRRDRDLLIADWGMHHLHLSSTIGAEGRFVERGDDLLFGVFGGDTAYLIGIYPHGSWALKELIEIVVANWSDAGIVYEMVAISQISPEYTDEERLQLRKAGVATSMISVGGKVYITLGQTTAGTPSGATRAANDLMHRLRELSETGDQKLRHFEDEVERIQHRKISGTWEPAIIGRLAGLRCEDLFYEVADLDPIGLTL